MSCRNTNSSLLSTSNLKQVREVFPDVVFELEDEDELVMAKHMEALEPLRPAPKRAATVLIAGPPSSL